jgi:hypothetical protein
MLLHPTSPLLFPSAVVSASSCTRGLIRANAEVGTGSCTTSGLFTPLFMLYHKPRRGPDIAPIDTSDLRAASCIANLLV